MIDKFQKNLTSTMNNQKNRLLFEMILCKSFQPVRLQALHLMFLPKAL